MLRPIRSANIYIADRENNRIRKVASDGTISTVAGTGVAGNSGDEELAVKATLNSPSSVTSDAQGNLYIADTGNHRIRIVSTSGTMLPFPSAGLSSPVYAVPDGKGNVFVADSDNGAIIEAMPDGIVTTIAANLKSPRGMTFDAAGNLYFTEAAGAHVKRLGAAGDVTLIGEGVWNIPRGVAVDNAGNIYVADTGLQQILRVAPTGAIAVIAGIGTAGFAGDGGYALPAELNFPWDVATGFAGVLYVADLENNRVRSLTPGTTANTATILVVSAVNAASLQTGPLAPGMLLDLLGTGLGPSDAAQTQVLFGGISAPILSLDSSRLLVRVPTQLEGEQSVNVQILNQGNLFAQIPASVVDAAPALYVDASGNLIAVNQDGTANTIANPVGRGSIVVFFGTGEGVTGLPISVAIGGYDTDVLYAGPVAGYPGLLQINARVPAGYVAPGIMSVVVTVGTASTQSGLNIFVN